MTNEQLEYQIWTHVMLSLLAIKNRLETRINSQVSGQIGSEVWFVVRSQGRVSSTTQLCRRVKVLTYAQLELSGGDDV